MAFEDWKGTPFVRYLLPIIPAGSKIDHSKSKLSDDKVGKLPGKWLSQDGWVGFPGWQDHVATDEDLDWWAKWYTHFGQVETIGMRTGDYIFVDIDVTDPQLASEIAAGMMLFLGPAPIRSRANSAKCGLLYKLDTRPGASLMRVRKSRIVFADILCCEQAVEVLGDGEQFVCEGLHPSGVQHEWDENPRTADLTAITPSMIDVALSYVRERAIEHGYTLKHASAAERAFDSAAAAVIGDGDVAPDIDKLAEILRLIPADRTDFSDYHSWFTALCAIKQSCAGDETFYHDHVVPWAATVPDNMRDEGDWLRAKWDSISATEVGFAHLEHVAHSYGYTGDAQRMFEALPVDEDQPAAGNGPPLATDLEGLVADLFVERHARIDRGYVVVPGSDRGQWYECTDGIWRPAVATRGAIERVCHEVAEPISRLPGSVNAARTRKLYSEHTVAAVERLLRGRDDIIMRRDELDAHPYLFGVPGGYVDDKGVLREPDPGLMLTRYAAVRPADTEDCPIFLSRLKALFGGDPDKLACFGSFIGAALAGTGDQQKFLFMLGEQGGEGKTTFLMIIDGIMGGYSSVVDYSAFMAKTQNRFQLGDIAGKRFLIAAETDDGQTWADTRLKEITGSGAVLIEQKYVPPFKVMPSWMLFFAGNSMPSFRRADPALQRRLCTLVVDHAVTQPDIHFRRNAVEGPEAPGILRWMINREQEYIQSGALILPPSVQAVSDEFFEDMDYVGQWIEQCVVFDVSAITPTRSMADHYNAWAVTQNIRQARPDAFARDLRARKELKQHRVKFDRSRVNGTQQRCTFGMRLRQDPDVTADVLQFVPRGDTSEE